MTSLKKCLYNPPFSHIYIEKEIENHPNTKRILAHFPKSRLIEINHYKDVFCRSRQNFSLQKKTPCLVLAKKRENFLYEGASVCQDFGNRHFYYTSMIMNCIYDCEYCYLQGMYPSANIVIFVNMEDYFAKVEELLLKHSAYFCISYDTDLLAMEQWLGYVKEWFSFVSNHSNITVELRTKSANWPALADLTPQQNLILAWTLSPDTIIRNYEHHTPSLKQRLDCIRKAADKGFPVRICFDPIIYLNGWKELYHEMIENTFSEIPPRSVSNVSIGVFRISSDYLKRIRKQRQDSAIVHYPFENDRGVYHYGSELTNLIISYTRSLVKKYISDEKIYTWQSRDSNLYI